MSSPTHGNSDNDVDVQASLNPPPPESSLSRSELLQKQWSKSCPFRPADSAPSAADGNPLGASAQQQPTPQWLMTRPVLDHCPRQTRCQLRALDRAWSLEDVRQHRYRDDAWIAVDGKVCAYRELGGEGECSGELGY